MYLDEGVRVEGSIALCRYLHASSVLDLVLDLF